MSENDWKDHKAKSKIDGIWGVLKHIEEDPKRLNLHRTESFFKMFEREIIELINDRSLTEVKASQYRAKMQELLELRKSIRPHDEPKMPESVYVPRTQGEAWVRAIDDIINNPSYLEEETEEEIEEIKISKKEKVIASVKTETKEDKEEPSKSEKVSIFVHDDDDGVEILNRIGK